MRTNRYGVRGLSGVHLKRGLVYFWVPPLSLQRAGVFKHKTLGTDFAIAVAEARHWNTKLEAYRAAINGVRPRLTTIRPGTVGHLVRQFEASPRYARYSYRKGLLYVHIYPLWSRSVNDDQPKMKLRSQHGYPYKFFTEQLPIHWDWN